MVKESRIIAQGSIPEFEKDGDDKDKYYLPVRGLCLPGPHHFLPDEINVRAYQEYFNQILTNLEMKPRNIFYVPDTGYTLDRSIINFLTTHGIEAFKKNFPSDVKYKVWPYAVTKETIEWIELLRLNGYKIEPRFNEKSYQFNDPAHRGGWGRWVNNPEETPFPIKANIPYPVSWIGQGGEEILEAYNRVVEETGNSKVVLKPIFSAGGFTLKVVNNQNELLNYYQSLSEGGLLTNPNIWEGEMPIEVQEYIDITGELYSIQYLHGKRITPGGISVQLVENTNWIGNGFNFEVEEDVVIQANEIWKNFKNTYPDIEKSWGGLDLALTSRGLIVLEHNGGRLTGAVPVIFMAQQLNLGNYPFAAKKSPGNPNCDLKTLWNFLELEKLALNKNGGIFPIVWFPGSGMLMAFANTPKETLQILDTAYNKLLINNYIS